MTKDDKLYIFRQFWPDNGYEGIKTFFPGWSRQRAGTFALRNGIKMTDEARTRIAKEAGKQGGAWKNRTAMSNTTENKLLRMKW